MNIFEKIYLGFGLFILIVVIGLLYSFFVSNRQSRSAVKIGDAEFKVEIADSIIGQARGLSGRANLPEDEGMLFIFSSPASHSFWMKGMNFPLDIIWISGNKIIQIDKNVPFPEESGGNLELYSSFEPVDKVLEINAGLSDKLGIKIGDEIINMLPFK